LLYFTDGAIRELVRTKNEWTPLPSLPSRLPGSVY
jgi:hypothetical protein